MANNASQDGIQKIVDSIINTTKTKKEENKKVQNDWKKLASLKL